MAMGLIQRSFCGGVLILVIIAVRILWLDKLPKRTFPVLWCLALARLLLPFTFSSVFSLYTFLQTVQRQAVQEPYPARMWEGVTITGSQPAWTVVQDLALGQEPTALAGEDGLGLLGAVWGAGALALAVFFAAAYARSLWQFRMAVPVEDGRVQQWLDRCAGRRRGRIGRIAVRQSDRILAPLTYGCLRPVILLPGRALEGSGQELRYILRHEFVHIRHHDAALKLAMVAALCLHWFNPLVWVMCRLMNRDMELACDEGVLRRFGEEARAGYAMTLIGMEEGKRVLLPLYNGFSKNAIEERVCLIMRYKKIKHAAIMASTLLVACLALVFATSARTAQATEGQTQNLESGADSDTYGDDADGLPLDPPLDRGAAEGRNEEPAVIDRDASGEDSGTEAHPERKYTLRYMQEGIPQEEPAYLYQGQGYGLLIPESGWKSGVPDEWMWESDGQVRFWVADYSGNTWEEARDILEQEGYAGTEAADVLRKEEDGMVFCVRLSESGSKVMGIHYAYPAVSEYEEGFGIILPVIAANFAIWQEDNQDLSADAQGMSADVRQMEQLATAFWEAYLAGDAAELAQYLSADYGGGVETFPDGLDGHVTAQAQLLAVKGLDGAGPLDEDKVIISMEFRPAADADYLEYLTISAVKEGDGWKVAGYGLEL